MSATEAQAHETRPLDLIEQASLMMSFASMLFGDLVFSDNKIEDAFAKLKQLEEHLPDLRRSLEAEAKRIGSQHPMSGALMSFADFCKTNSVTTEERLALVLHLLSIRTHQFMRAFGVLS